VSYALFSRGTARRLCRDASACAAIRDDELRGLRRDRGRRRDLRQRRRAVLSVQPTCTSHRRAGVGERIGARGEERGAVCAHRGAAQGAVWAAGREQDGREGGAGGAAVRRAVHGRAGGEAAEEVGAARLDWSAGHPGRGCHALRCSRLCEDPPNHRTRLVAARLASYRRAWTKPIGSLAEQRILIRLWALSRAVHAGWCRRRLRSPSGDCFGPELRVSLRPIAAHRGHRHWPGPSPARVRPRSLVPFKLKFEAAGSGQRLRPLSGHCGRKFVRYTPVVKCVRGDLSISTKARSRVPFV
jgi:hypothetical protein